MSKLIVNVETGDTVERDLTEAEKDQQKIDEAEIKANQEAIQAEIDAKETAKAEIADRLGLTLDELKLLLG